MTVTRVEINKNFSPVSSLLASTCCLSEQSLQKLSNLYTFLHPSFSCLADLYEFELVITAMLSVLVQVLAFTAGGVLDADYPAIPTDKTTPVQQRIAINGPNGMYRESSLQAA